ncbi:hypothetical protein GN316_03230 [Xylophilus sp. Kf1]|nr:hypothetical protein [Xylophilus sp. Kf1]
MAEATTIARIERLVWILIYGGLLCLILGFAVRATAAGAGVALMVAGLLAAAGGIVLIFVRARMQEDET